MNKAHVSTLSTEDAVRHLRSESRYRDLVRDTYLDEDVEAAAARFATSGEWDAEVQLLGERIQGARVVDVGAGIGLASRAFVLGGAKSVWAIEPDPSEEVGRGALARVCRGLSVDALDCRAEDLRLPDGCADIVYARQVLHHTRDLNRALRECARVLRPGGIFLACREHVVESEDELRKFRASHPVHQLTGGENAYRLSEYRDAIADAGLRMTREFGPFESVINLFPAVQADSEIPHLVQTRLRQRFGWFGARAARIPVIYALALRRITRPRPGRLHTFLAQRL